MDKMDWAPGEIFAAPIVAHIDALRQGGPDYLTQAFRASGALGADNRVASLSNVKDFAIGGTGAKASFDVTYEKPAPGLHQRLFAKFSRNFSDPRRDRARHMLESEVRFAALSRDPAFPIAVADCLYADFHSETGTGVLITERLAFGEHGIEPQAVKCFDYELDDAIGHYRAIQAALGRLAGSHKAGKLPDGFAHYFPIDIDSLIAQDRIGFSAEQLQRRAARMGEFAAQCPQLLPESLRDADFYKQIAEEAPFLLAHEDAIRRRLFANPDHVALCHWNANIDNAWFWKTQAGELQCGLLDWGRVGPMHIGQAIYGGLSGAEPELWDRHLDDLIALFASEFEQAGGPKLDLDEFKLAVNLVTATMGLAYIMDAPAIIAAKAPDYASATSRTDPRITQNEDARTWLHMMAMFLNQWRTQDFGALPERIL